MCNSVHSGGREYATPRALAELVGGVDHLIWQDPTRGEQILDSCLCPVDIPRTLLAAGVRCQHGPDPMEWFVQEVTR